MDGMEKSSESSTTPWRARGFVTGNRRIPYDRVVTAGQKRALAGVLTIDKKVMHGAPCFAKTRVPVQTLIDFPETGETIDDFLAVYPAIRRQHVFSFLELSRNIAIDQLTCAS